MRSTNQTPWHSNHRISVVRIHPLRWLLRQSENRNRVAVRKSHLKIASGGDGNVLDSVYHMGDGRSFDPRTRLNFHSFLPIVASNASK